MEHEMFTCDFSPFQSQKLIYYTGTMIPPSFYPDLNILLRHILFRQHQNMNTFIIVCGSVRTGKSYFALKIAELYSTLKGEAFNVNEQVSFDIKPFLIWSKKATKGVFVLDEVSTNLNPAEWYTLQSKIMRNFVFCQGFRNNILFLVLPNVAFLLKAIRFMANYIVQTRKQGLVSVSKITMDHALGKGWHDYLGNIHFGLPTQNTIKDYEVMKREWNDKHLDQDIDYIEMLDRPDYSSELRMKRLELDVKIREKRLIKLTNDTNDTNVWE